MILGIKKKSISFLLGIILIICGYCLFKFSSPQFERIFLYDINSPQTQLTVDKLPFFENGKHTTYVFDFNLKPNRFFLMQKKFSIKYDDCFVSVDIDGIVKYPKDFNYPKDQECKHSIYKPLDLSSYLTYDTRYISFKVRNYGGLMGFDLSYSLSDPITFTSALLILFGFTTVIHSLLGFLRKLEPFLKDKIVSHLELLFLLACLAIGCFIRLHFKGEVSGDFSSFLSKWYDYISIHGWSAYQYVFSDYFPLYLYLIKPFTSFSIKPLYTFKIISFVFEIITCIFVYLIVSQNNNRKNGYLAAGICFLLPQIILNGAYWGQCDAVYTCFVIGALYFLIKSKNHLALIFLGIACSLKLQALFIMPLFVILCLKDRNFKFSLFLWIPAIYFLSFIPALLNGFPIQEIFHVLLHQISTYQSLNNGSANFYAFTQHLSYKKFFPFFISIAFGIIGYISYLVFKKLSNSAITVKEMVAYGLIISMTTIFFLPKMHERYFTISEVLVVLYVFAYKKHWFILPMTILASLIAYLNYLAGLNIPLYIAAILNATVLFLLYKWHLNKRTKQEKTEMILLKNLNDRSILGDS